MIGLPSGAVTGSEVPPGPSRSPLEVRIGSGSLVNGTDSGAVEAATPTA